METSAKQLVYRYNGVATSEEVEQDLDGEVPIPEQNAFVHRHGKSWRAVHIVTETNSDGRIPVVRVFLSDQF